MYLCLRASENYVNISYGLFIYNRLMHKSALLYAYRNLIIIIICFISRECKYQKILHRYDVK